MDMKKFFLTGSCIAALAMFAACSDDKSSGTGPMEEEPTLSSAGEVNPSSSGGGNVPVSSSSVVSKTPQMSITEIMYNAPDNSELEWVEITLASGPDIQSMLALKVRLEGAVTYDFPAEPLTKGEYIVVTNNVELFKATYPSFAGRLFGPWENDAATGLPARLSNEGDVIDVKISGDGDVSASYSKEPPWPSLANGKGRTLVYKGGNPAQSSSWGASKILNGNPGVGNDEWLESSSVRLNEIKPYASDADPAWIELYNSGDEAVDVTGWTFESKLRHETFAIKAGIVPAKGYLVLQGTTDFDKEVIVSPIGGAYYLYGNEEGDESSLLLPSSVLSSGIVDLSDGSIAQGALQVATPGAANSPLYIGSLVISEINYHPNDEKPNQVEFLELKNMGVEAITLYNNVTGGSRGWKIEGINFEFSPGDVVPAGGMVVLFPDSLQTALGEDKLRTRYSIDPSVLVKFYKGKLSNRGEMVAVKKPYSYQASATDAQGQWYYDWSDATIYSDSWSGSGIDYKRADGFDYSLQRVDFTTMGYEAAAWTVGEPTPGR